MSEQPVEQEAKGQVFTVTPERINDVIVSEHYFTALQGARMGCLDAVDELGGCVPSWAGSPLDAELGLLTFCVLLLKNGFKVTGESACNWPATFNAERGRNVARANAIAKIWPLEGYLLKQSLHDQAANPPRTS